MKKNIKGFGSTVAMEPSNFVRLVGNTARTRILDFFLENEEWDYPLTDVAKLAGVSWSTVNVIVPQLLELEFIKKTRKVGRSTMYSLNVDNPFIKHLLKFDLELAYQECKKEVKRQEESEREKYV